MPNLRGTAANLGSISTSIYIYFAILDKCSLFSYACKKNWGLGPVWEEIENEHMYSTLYYYSRPERLIKIISTRDFLVIKEINKYLVDMILINYFRSGSICTSQSLFRHSYVVGQWLNRHMYCDVRIDIGIRADELGLITMSICTSQCLFLKSFIYYIRMTK
jgi:hypothetical protein